MNLHLPDDGVALITEMEPAHLFKFNSSAYYTYKMAALGCLMALPWKRVVGKDNLFPWQKCHLAEHTVAVALVFNTH